MGGHSDEAVGQAISTDGLLAEKLKDIVGTLRGRLAADFQRLLGVPIPAPAATTVNVQDYDLISTQTSIGGLIEEYERGAEDVARAKIADPSRRRAAVAVVRSVLGFAEGAGGVCAGGYAASAALGPARGWVGALVCEVDRGSAAEWKTPVDFWIISLAFVVWSSDSFVMTEDGQLRKPQIVAPCFWPLPTEVVAPR